MVPIHAPKRSQIRMMNDEIRRNREIRMTKTANAQRRTLRHPGLGFLSSLVIGHWSFHLLVGSIPVAAGTAAGLTIGWTNNMLTVGGPNIPGGKVDIWYLEAFCRSGSTMRDWRQTTIPHKTKLLFADEKSQRLKLSTAVEPSVEVLHDLRAGKDEVDFRLTLKNNGAQFSDVQWFQPCMRVDRFSGGNQSNYIAK